MNYSKGPSPNSGKNSSKQSGDKTNIIGMETVLEPSSQAIGRGLSPVKKEPSVADETIMDGINLTQTQSQFRKKANETFLALTPKQEKRQEEENVKKMQDMNDNLKLELAAVIAQMEQQIARLQTKRAQNQQLQEQLKEGLHKRTAVMEKKQRKIYDLTEKNEQLWRILDQDCNLEEVTSLENSFKDKVKEISELRQTYRNLANVARAQTTTL